MMINALRLLMKMELFSFETYADPTTLDAELSGRGVHGADLWITFFFFLMACLSGSLRVTWEKSCSAA